MFSFLRAAPTITSNISTPVLVNATSSTGKWHITSNWNDELAGKVVNFLTSNPFEFYGSGQAPSREAAQNLVNGARARTEAGIPRALEAEQLGVEFFRPVEFLHRNREVNHLLQIEHRFPQDHIGRCPARCSIFAQAAAGVTRQKGASSPRVP